MDAREQAIQEIEALFPTDSQYRDIKEIGERLLAQARAENWRKESTPVLVRYAELCRAEESRLLVRRKA